MSELKIGVVGVGNMGSGNAKQITISFAKTWVD